MTKFQMPVLGQKLNKTTSTLLAHGAKSKWQIPLEENKNNVCVTSIAER